MTRAKARGTRPSRGVASANRAHAAKVLLSTPPFARRYPLRPAQVAEARKHIAEEIERLHWVQHTTGSVHGAAGVGRKIAALIVLLEQSAPYPPRRPVLHQTQGIHRHEQRPSSSARQDWHERQRMNAVNALSTGLPVSFVRQQWNVRRQYARCPGSPVLSPGVGENAESTAALRANHRELRMSTPTDAATLPPLPPVPQAFWCGSASRSALRLVKIVPPKV